MESGIDHLDLRVADLARSVAFYEAALAPLGRRRRPGGRIDPAGAPEVLFAREDLDGSSFALHAIAPGAPGQDTVTTGAHIAFSASGPVAVAAFRAAATTAGGRDIGAPGPRPEYSAGYHGAFVLDPDGNNIEAVPHRLMSPAAQKSASASPPGAGGTPGQPSSSSSARLRSSPPA